MLTSTIDTAHLRDLLGRNEGWSLHHEGDGFEVSVDGGARLHFGDDGGTANFCVWMSCRLGEVLDELDRLETEPGPTRLDTHVLRDVLDDSTPGEWVYETVHDGGTPVIDTLPIARWRDHMNTVDVPVGLRHVTELICLGHTLLPQILNRIERLSTQNG